MPKKTCPNYDTSLGIHLCFEALESVPKLENPGIWNSNLENSDIKNTLEISQNEHVKNPETPQKTFEPFECKLLQKPHKFHPEIIDRIENKKSVYHGDTLNGVPHGYGTKITKKSTFSGWWKNGVPHGPGVKQHSRSFKGLRFVGTVEMH